MNAIGICESSCMWEFFDKRLCSNDSGFEVNGEGDSFALSSSLATEDVLHSCMKGVARQL